jgi:hypothetical protein
MASSVVQSNANSGAATSLTVVLGAAPTAGNTLLAIMASDTTHAGVPTAGAGNSYTQRLAQVGGQGFYVWTRLVAGGESATTTFTPSTADPAGLVVAEIQGTYDKIGAGTTITGSALATRDTTTLSPTTTDNIVLAIAGIHAPSSTVGSGGGVDNTFTFLRAVFSAGGLAAGVVTGWKTTGSTGATGTTTLSWTNNYKDRDGVQIAFTGIGGAAAAKPNPHRLIQIAVHRASLY